METKDILRKTATAVSSVFSPLLIPTYGLAILMTVLISRFRIPIATTVIILSVTFILTGLLPFAIIRGMIAMKRAKDMDLTDRRERTVPFIATFLLYVVAILYLYRVNLPLWMLAFMIGGAIALAVASVVNRWWKISAHSTAMGGLTAVASVCSVMIPSGGLLLICLTLSASGLVGTSRLLLGAHTPAQVYAGWSCGFLFVLLSMFLIY